MNRNWVIPSESAPLMQEVCCLTKSLEGHKAPIRKIEFSETDIWLT